jgi:hypothetical protein
MWRMLAISVAIAGLTGVLGCGSENASKTPVLALVSAECQKSLGSSIPTMGCSGQVKNLTSSVMSDIQVDIAWLDSNGKVIARTQPQLIDALILPGKAVQWEAQEAESDYADGRHDYRIEFSDSSGAKLETVDQSEQ